MLLIAQIARGRASGNFRSRVADYAPAAGRTGFGGLEGGVLGRQLRPVPGPLEHFTAATLHRNQSTTRARWRRDGGRAGI